VHIADFKELVGEVRVPVPDIDWGELETGLGFAFPMEYREIFSAYPDLEIDHFLGMNHPGLDSRDARLKAAWIMDVISNVVRSPVTVEVYAGAGSVDEREFNFSVYPSVNGLFPWGTTQNGDTCLWLMSERSPESWPTVVTDETDFWLYPHGMLSLIGGLIDRSVECPFFPNYLSNPPRIEQFPVKRFQGM
jgi:hypothetical protein